VRSWSKPLGFNRCFQSGEISGVSDLIPTLGRYYSEYDITRVFLIRRWGLRAKDVSLVDACKVAVAKWILYDGVVPTDETYFRVADDVALAEADILPTRLAAKRRAALMVMKARARGATGEFFSESILNPLSVVGTAADEVLAEANLTGCRVIPFACRSDFLRFFAHENISLEEDTLLDEETVVEFLRSQRSALPPSAPMIVAGVDGSAAFPFCSFGAVVCRVVPRGEDVRITIDETFGAPVWTVGHSSQAEQGGLAGVLRRLLARTDLGPRSHVVILTDSLSNITSLGTGFGQDAAEAEVRDLLCQLADRSQKVVVRHVKGHAGIALNEMADAAADLHRNTILRECFSFDEIIFSRAPCVSPSVRYR